MTGDPCVECKCEIPDDETAYYLEVETCRRTFWSPVEYDMHGPLCGRCEHALQQRDARDEEERQLRCYSDEERERI